MDIMDIGGGRVHGCRASRRRKKLISAPRYGWSVVSIRLSMASALSMRSSVIAALLRQRREQLAGAAAAGVDLHDLAGLRILQDDQAQIRQGLFTRIADIDRNQIVTAGRLTQSTAQR